MTSFTSQAITLIRAIPAGTVTTYGAISTAAGNHRGARQIARLLAGSSEALRLPWHRVVNKDGIIPPRLSMGHIEQRRLLTAEGVEVSADGRIDLSRFFWLPGDPSRPSAT
ncbi:MGMT family protein [Desulfofustis glycolicus]|uniref:Methylated-DNA-protein-cysteine methyltransferase related protein n=1 Tax=Desulfofustis glycolicus DSM 9705 TaxID=1121409 RepID=A0A1M5XRC9_9BACT|nr:MGMT family protein [Desulfofustis glycolicus]MCB2217840.1 MGMT family protein [Desulfobulbaceae bacterium]SHI02395.1 methylated-DNA-protein-cysteine methyltransferase related protein [Desulfofustis glycolicus DSM 9705]